MLTVAILREELATKLMGNPLWVTKLMDIKHTPKGTVHQERDTRLMVNKEQRMSTTRIKRKEFHNVLLHLTLATLCTPKKFIRVMYEVHSWLL
mmetsp:Transcript_91202/g.144047  ORF Transcript_91202/g.144047 Transcript_91202/m.144047 type:complete len:93 (-) Transcript_91202:81-359(-)